MKQLVVWVEGPGDVAATPLLLKKLLYGAGHHGWHVPTPIEVGELPKLRKVLARRAEELRVKMEQGRCHGLLVLLDLDDAAACPVQHARALAAELTAYALPYPVAVVFARREYEEWLVASLPTIAPTTTILDDNLRRDYPPESRRGVKEWLGKHSGNRYVVTVHQAEFTRHLNPALAAAECRSFRRLQSALAELLVEAAAAGTATPLAAAR